MLSGSFDVIWNMGYCIANPEVPFDRGLSKLSVWMAPLFKVFFGMSILYF